MMADLRLDGKLKILSVPYNGIKMPAANGIYGTLHGR